MHLKENRVFERIPWPLILVLLLPSVQEFWPEVLSPWSDPVSCVSSLRKLHRRGRAAGLVVCVVLEPTPSWVHCWAVVPKEWPPLCPHHQRPVRKAGSLAGPDSLNQKPWSEGSSVRGGRHPSSHWEGASCRAASHLWLKRSLHIWDRA